jgi:acetyltransferase-like isoleucine patch superfamily enzyme
MEDVQLVNSDIDPSCAIYRGARVKNATLGAGCVVGNFSRVDDSVLAFKTRIDRNNHIFQSRLGRYTYTGMNTVIMHAEIGAFTSISWNVSIGGANHDFNRVAQHSFLYNVHDELRPDNAAVPYDRFAEPVQVGCDVWIAAGAVITRGVRIGHGAVIGANAVVTKDVEPYSVVVGSPARVIKKRFADDIVAALLELQWWDWPSTKITEHFAQLSSAPELDTLRRLSNENRND